MLEEEVKSILHRKLWKWGHSEMNKWRTKNLGSCKQEEEKMNSTCDKTKRYMVTIIEERMNDEGSESWKLPGVEEISSE